MKTNLLKRTVLAIAAVFLMAGSAFAQTQIHQGTNVTRTANVANETVANTLVQDLGTTRYNVRVVATFTSTSPANASTALFLQLSNDNAVGLITRVASATDRLALGHAERTNFVQLVNDPRMIVIGGPQTADVDQATAPQATDDNVFNSGASGARIDRMPGFLRAANAVNTVTIDFNRLPNGDAQISFSFNNGAVRTGIIENVPDVTVAGFHAFMGIVANSEMTISSWAIYDLTPAAAGDDAVFTQFAVNGVAVDLTTPATTTGAIPYGDDLANVVVTFAAPGAEVSIDGDGTITSGAIVNFTSPRTFTVTGDGLETTIYTVTLTHADPLANLLTFTANGVTIAPSAAMSHTFPFETVNLAAVPVTFTMSPGATMSIDGDGAIASGATVNFTNARTFTVNPASGPTAPGVHVVTLSMTPISTASELTALTLGGIAITPIGPNMTFAMPFGMDRSALPVTFTTSPYATVSVDGTTIASGSTVDFSRPVTLVVTAQDGIATTSYEVTVTLGQPLVGPLTVSFVDPQTPTPVPNRTDIPSQTFLRDIDFLAFAMPGMVGDWQIGGPGGNSNFRASGNNIGAGEAASFGFEPGNQYRGLGIADVQGTVTLTMEAIVSKGGREWGSNLTDASVVLQIVRFEDGSEGTATVIRNVTLADLDIGGSTGGSDVPSAGTPPVTTITTILTLEETFETTGGFFVRQPMWNLAQDTERARLRILSMNAALAPNTEAELLAFYVDGNRAIIDSDAETVTLELPYGTITPLPSSTVEFITARGASATFDGTAATPPITFTFVDGEPVNLVLTPQAGGETVTYVVTVSVEGTPSTDFLTFSANGHAFDVAELDGIVHYLPFMGTDLENITVVFTASPNTAVTIGSTPVVSGGMVDFSAGPVTFTVTSTLADIHFSTYVVDIRRMAISQASDLLTFVVNHTEEALISDNMLIEMPFGTFMDAIRVTFTTSDYATVTAGGVVIESGAELDFTTSPITFRVTSEAGAPHYTEYIIDITERAGTGQAWHFRNWTNATLDNLAADPAWTATAGNDRFFANQATSDLNPVVANSTPIREFVGLRFITTSGADRLRIDHAMEFNRMQINGTVQQVVVQNATEGDYISFIFGTASAGVNRTLSATTNATFYAGNASNSAGNVNPSMAVFRATADGDVIFTADAALNFFRITLSSDEPMSEDTRFVEFAVVLGGEEVELSPTVGGITHTLPYGTDPTSLENVEVRFTLGHELAVASIGGTDITSPHTVNFTNSPVTFRVTAEAGNHSDYPVSVVIGNPEAYMLNFTASGINIAPSATMSEMLPFGTSLTAIPVTFAVSYGATVAANGNPLPTTGSATVDFSGGPVTFTVTSATTAEFTVPVVRTYVVTLTVGVRPAFATFTIVGGTTESITQGAPGAIAIERAGSAENLVVNFTTTPADAVVHIEGRGLVTTGHIHNFTSPVTYMVTDEASGGTVTYVVTVTDPNLTSIQDGMGGIEVISFYPNPTMDVLNITANNIRTIEVINMMGTVVISTSGSGNTHTLDVSTLAPGLHFIRVTTDTGISVGRFVKQ